MKKLDRFMRSKNGKIAAGVFVLLMIIAIVLVGGLNGGFLSGTAGLPAVEQDCMPTCEERDGRMFSLVGGGMASFGGEKVVVWVSVPQDYASFTLSLFDGDSGKDSIGNVNLYGDGNWDSTTSVVTYTLYADPLKDGTGSQVVGQWSSDQMPNNAWFDIPIDNVADAVGENNDYFYRFEASRPTEEYGISAFKMKSQNAYLSMGRSSQAGANIAIVGMIFGRNDIPYIYPNFVDFSNIGDSTYSGGWEFQFYLPSDATQVEIWNGDADRGTSTATDYDTDDANTSGKPDWSGPATVDEWAGQKGNPADDYSFLLFTKSPAVHFILIGPDGNEIARDENPSGTEEWERFLVSTDANTDAEVVVSSLPEGNYKFRIEGLDMYNTLFLRTDLELFQGPPPPPPPPQECVPENTNLGGGYAIIALDPGKCQGQQNGLLFHGTSYTQLMGKAISNGCLRSVGTHTVQSAGVEYVGQYDNKNSKVKIIPDPYQVSTPVSVNVAAPNCKDPAAHSMNGKDFTGNVFLEPGLWCIDGDVTINATDSVKGEDVTLYFTNGKLTINGGASVELSAPYAAGVNVSPALSNILFYFPGANGKGQAVKINGSSTSYFTGVIYAPGSEVEFLGTSLTEGINATQIIGWDVRVGGTADLILGYAGTNLPVCTP